MPSCGYGRVGIVFYSTRDVTMHSNPQKQEKSLSHKRISPIRENRKFEQRQVHGSLKRLRPSIRSKCSQLPTPFKKENPPNGPKSTALKSCPCTSSQKAHIGVRLVAWIDLTRSVRRMYQNGSFAFKRPHHRMYHVYTHTQLARLWHTRSHLQK